MSLLNMNHMKSTDIFYLLLMAANMYKHMGKVMIKILQGSAVTLTMLGGLTIHPPVANFLQCRGLHVPKIMKIGW